MTDVQAYGPPFPTGLTHDPAKRRYHGTDSYFLEAYEQLSALTPDPVRFAAEHALLLVKPDAIVSRSVERITDWLCETGFRTVAASRLRMSRGAVRAMWHYQLNRATPQRSRLADTLCRASDSLVLLLQAPEGTGRPATVELSIRKGPADPARRRPNQLRSRLGGFGFLLNLVHASDEPADLVRELGILLEDANRRALCVQALAGNDQHDAVVALAYDLYAEQPAHDLQFAPAARRLARAVQDLLAAGGALPVDVQAALRHGLSVTTTEDPTTWAPLIEAIWRAELPLSGWDFTVVACAALPMSRPQYTPLLSGTDPAVWREPVSGALL